MFTKLRIVLAILAAFSAIGIFTSSASAYCGPGFHSKAEYIAFYKSPEGKPYAKGVESFLEEHAKYYHYHADQGLINYLEQQNVEYFHAPANYHIDKNTWCPGPGKFLNYEGRYDVSEIGMLWYCSEAGENGHHGHNCAPIAKGYCRNLTIGPKIRKRRPHKPKCKCECRHKCHPPRHHCGCHKKPKKPKVTKPSTKEEICSNNNASNGSNICGGGPCSNTTVISGSGNTVNNEVKCEPGKEEKPKPPCECTPPEGKVEFVEEYEFQEAHPNEPPILYWIEINAPVGDNLTIYFITEKAWFDPSVTQVASFGEQTKFQSYWHVPSDPGHYPVHVKVVDHTLEKTQKKFTFEFGDQSVPVIPWELEEGPR